MTRGIAQILTGRAQHLYLGNLEARRDWGYAPEYVEAMWLMLQQDDAGRLRHRHRRDALRAGARRGGLRAGGSGLGGVRPHRPALLSADRSRPALGGRQQGRRVLGWEPRTTFRELVRIMLAADLAEAGMDVSRYPALQETPREAAVV